MKYYKVNAKHKDRVFRIIFQDKEALLELYNAVNNSDYTNPDDLTITTIEDVVYMGMKNDLSFIIGDVMNMYEHQSSFSPNLPLRGLLYFASLYRTYIEPVKQRLYTDIPLNVPFPQYLVFYNGTKEEPERQELHLSDLFTGNAKGKTPALECTAVVLNINLGYNKALMEKCHKLKEYAEFIDCIRRFTSKEQTFEEAVERAVDQCIKEGILVDILRKNRSEVVEMILEEWDENEFREYLKEESWKEGRSIGREEGRSIGREEGIRGIIKICRELKMDKETIVEKLIATCNLEKSTAEDYVEKYWE